MPELPEVETMRRGVLKIVGAQITDAACVPNSCKPIRVEPDEKTFRRRVVGQRVTAVDRLGKRVVVRLENDDAVIFEPRMTGLVLLASPPDREHLRFRLQLAGKVKELLFWDRRGLGTVSLCSRVDLEQNLVGKKLGPDALAVSVEQLRDRLGKSHRAIKVALLDQKRLAGIGNLYASEILHRACIHPSKPASRLRPADWMRIHSAMLMVLHDAIAHEGSTLSDGTYRNALNNPGGYQNHHTVYDRAGESCQTCGVSLIQRIVQAQRSTFYCPTCQRKAR